MYKKITALFITAALLFSACQTAGTVPGPELVPESSESSSQVSSSSSEPSGIVEENKKVPDAETVSAYLMEEESLGGIKLGMTEEEVNRMWGDPIRSSYELTLNYDYDYMGCDYDDSLEDDDNIYGFFSVDFVNKGYGRIVNSVKIYDPRFQHKAQTARGIKVGCTKKEVQAAYADLIDPALFPNEAVWDLGLIFHGLRFTFHGDRVSSIELGDLIFEYEICGCENYDPWVNHRASMDSVESESLAHIKLNMTEQEVIEKLGEPDVISTTGEMQNQYGYQYTYYFYGGNGTTENDYKMRIVFVDKGKGKFVNHLRIQNDSKAALSTGIQIGSTVEDIEKTYENQINTELTDDNKIVVGFSLRGLHFGLKDGKVNAIDLGYLIPPIDMD